MSEKATLASLVGLLATVGACSLVNAPDDVLPPGSGGSGASSTGGTATTGGNGGSGGMPECTTDPDCANADTDPCTIHICGPNNTCVLDSTTDPNDDDACTTDSCDPVTAQPVHEDIPPMDDNDACTIDYCDPAVGPRNELLAPIWEEDFSTNDFGWTLEGPWEIGPAIKGGTPVTSPFEKIGDPELDHSAGDDNGVAGVVIGGYTDPTAAIPMQYLTSPEFDATIPAQLQNGRLYLRFWRWLVADYEPFMRHTVEVWDGSAWQVVFSLPNGPVIADSDWKRMVYDITPYANANMRLRFGHAVLQAGVYPDAGSWTIDDVAVGFAKVELDDMNLCTDTVCDPVTGMVTHEPVVDIDDMDPCTFDTACDPARGVNHYDRLRKVVHDFSSAGSETGFTGQWQRGPAMMGVGDPPDDNTDSGDNAILGVNIGGAYNVNTSTAFTYSVNLAVLSTADGTVNLTWQRWLNAGPSGETPHRVELWRGGTLLTTLFSNGGLATMDNKWVEMATDLTPFLTTNPQFFQLRYSYQVTTSAATPRGGWNIDDVVVTTSACLP
ncbi:MAG: hypothetical protein KC731_30195 [Myxococcales bacterium]|nr:hypothetical protein [Myxococcales bacterium]